MLSITNNFVFLRQYRKCHGFIIRKTRQIDSQHFSRHGEGDDRTNPLEFQTHLDTRGKRRGGIDTAQAICQAELQVGLASWREGHLVKCFSAVDACGVVVFVAVIAQFLVVSRCANLV